jgi:hypothetical protein
VVCGAIFEFVGEVSLSLTEAADLHSPLVPLFHVIDTGSTSSPGRAWGLPVYPLP